MWWHQWCHQWWHQWCQCQISFSSLFFHRRRPRSCYVCGKPGGAQPLQTQLRSCRQVERWSNWEGFKCHSLRHIKIHQWESESGKWKVKVKVAGRWRDGQTERVSSATLSVTSRSTNWPFQRHFSILVELNILWEFRKTRSLFKYLSSITKLVSPMLDIGSGFLLSFIFCCPVLKV